MGHDTSGMVKVLLQAPGGEVETLWATPVGEGEYRLENSPFYAYRLSWLDGLKLDPTPLVSLHLNGSFANPVTVPSD